jgi:ABC-type antimicrobial peptide transport system permease subunit
MKKLKFKSGAIGLPIGWIIGMAIGLAVLWPVNVLWWIIQLLGLGACLLIMFATAKQINEDIKEDIKEDKYIKL